MKTLFVIGAGASADFGLPVGAALQSEICKFLRPNNSAQGYGRDIEFAIPEAVNLGLRYEKLFSTLDWVSRTLPLARSIDSFLENQSLGSDTISFLAKYSIATLIAYGERKSMLNVANARSKSDFAKISNSWLGQLWPLINRGGKARIDDKGLDDFAFLTFNYDRCIEQFLFLAFREYYDLAEADAVKFVERVSINHVYGSLGGGLPGQDGMPFGYTDLSDQRLSAAKTIKTYSEQLESHEVSRIGDMLESAGRIVFVGFSFAPMNTMLLERAFFNQDHLKQLHGTAYGMSDFDRQRAQEWCSRVYRRGEAMPNLDNETGVEFFRSHQLLFS